MEMKKNILLFCTSVLVAILFAEVMLQSIYWLKNKEWIWKESAFQVGYTEAVKDRRQYTLRANYTDKKKCITINSQRFRSFDSTPKDKPIIVVIGDSVPFGSGVRNEETYPVHLEKKLKEQGIDVTVINAGVPSYNLRQSFDRLQLEVLPHYNDIVLVIVQAANDISLITFFREVYSPDATWADIRWKHYPWENTILQKSAIMHYVKLVLDKKTVPEEHRPFKADVMLTSIESTVNDNVDALNKLSIPTVIVSVNPFYYQTNNLDRNEELRQWKKYEKDITVWEPITRDVNNTLRKVAINKNAYFFDAGALFDNFDRDHQFIDYIHLSNEGGMIMAEGLISYILEHKLVSK